MPSGRTGIQNPAGWMQDLYVKKTKCDWTIKTKCVCAMCTHISSCMHVCVICACVHGCACVLEEQSGKKKIYRRSAGIKPCFEGLGLYSEGMREPWKDLEKEWMSSDFCLEGSLWLSVVARIWEYVKHSCCLGTRLSFPPLQPACYWVRLSVATLSSNPPPRSSSEY